MCGNGPLERLRRNEQMFREVNERIDDVTDAFLEGVEDGGISIVCECADRECVARLTVPREQYRSVRADERELFIVAPGHEGFRMEEVVASEAGYLIVQKPS